MANLSWNTVQDLARQLELNNNNYYYFENGT